MPALPVRFTLLARLVLALAAACAAPSHAATQPPAPITTIGGLGKGLAPLDGPWQFHAGDDPAWAQPATSDATGANGWEQLSADKTWGAQGHPAYVGYAWYRLHVHLDPAPGASPEFALLIQHIDDAYEIYWNGRLIAHNGKMPPHPKYYFPQASQTFGMGESRDGVLAIRVWKAPLMSFDSDLLGGFGSAPLIGGPAAIGARKAELDYAWLRSRQYSFGLDSVYALVFALSLLGWLRNRSQHVLLAMAAYTGSKCAGLVLTGLLIPWSFNFAIGAAQPVLSLSDIGLWYLLLYLLQLEGNSRLVRITRVLAIIGIVSTSLDGLLTFLDWSNPWVAGWVQLTDAALTAIFTLTKVYPLVLVAFALRKRLAPARWLVAGTAFLASTILVLRVSLDQGSRYTHWTIGDRIATPLFHLNGNAFTVQTLADTLLVLAIIYAVYRFMQEAARRQSGLEQEFRSARELQQVLIPETLPELPGYAVTSSYRPAQEVGGDFFQIIPLEGKHAGSTLILLGDVSGKGLKAAMTVALIVGAARTLARFAPNPADLLAELNLRLHGRLQGGFVTCLALLLDKDARCTLASAGHPAPFLNDRELPLPGALPLGLVASSTYDAATIDLFEGDRFTLYTDGLLEARNASGEIFSFQRLDALFATKPNAGQATEAAVDFGQEDDITVLVLTRLTSGQKSTTKLFTRIMATA